MFTSLKKKNGILTDYNDHILKKKLRLEAIKEENKRLENLKKEEMSDIEKELKKKYKGIKSKKIINQRNKKQEYTEKRKI